MPVGADSDSECSDDYENDEEELPADEDADEPAGDASGNGLQVQQPFALSCTFYAFKPPRSDLQSIFIRISIRQDELDTSEALDAPLAGPRGKRQLAHQEESATAAHVGDPLESAGNEGGGADDEEEGGEEGEEEEYDEGEEEYDEGEEEYDEGEEGDEEANEEGEERGDEGEVDPEAGDEEDKEKDKPPVAAVVPTKGTRCRPCYGWI